MKTRRLDTIALILVTLVGFALRMYFVSTYHEFGDLVRFGQTAAIMARGGNIYVEQYYYNYSPLYGLFLGALYHVPLFRFDFVLRLFLSCITLANAVLASRIAGTPRVFVLYWLNPVFMLYEAYAGQFEQVALLPILLALYAPASRAFWLGALALLIKHITLPLVWALYVIKTDKPLRSALWMIAALALFAVSFAPYLPDGLNGIVSRVLLYRTPGQSYGFGSSALFYAAIVILPFVARALKLDIVDTLTFVVLGQLLFMPFASSNYFVLALGIGLLRPRWWLVPLGVVMLLLFSPWTSLETVRAFSGCNALWPVVLAALLGYMPRGPVKRFQAVQTTITGNTIQPIQPL